MNQQQPALNWERSKHQRIFACLPGLTFTGSVFTGRDVAWLIVVVGLSAAYGVDRWRTWKQHDARLSALTVAQAAADEARSQEVVLSDQLRSVREARNALAMQHDDDVETITKLNNDVSSLQEELRASRAALYTSRSARER